MTGQCYYTMCHAILGPRDCSLSVNKQDSDFQFVRVIKCMRSSHKNSFFRDKQRFKIANPLSTNILDTW